MCQFQCPEPADIKASFLSCVLSPLYVSFRLNYCSIVIIVLFPWASNISVSLNYEDIQFLDLSDDCKVTATLGLNRTSALVLLDSEASRW